MRAIGEGSMGNLTVSPTFVFYNLRNCHEAAVLSVLQGDLARSKLLTILRKCSLLKRATRKVDFVVITKISVAVWKMQFEP